VRQQGKNDYGYDSRKNKKVFVAAVTVGCGKVEKSVVMLQLAGVCRVPDFQNMAVMVRERRKTGGVRRQEREVVHNVQKPWVWV